MPKNWIAYKICVKERENKPDVLLFKIKVNDLKKTFSTGLYCEASEFDSQKNEVKGSPEKTMQLQDIIKDYQKSVIKLRKHSDLTPQMIWCDMFDKPYTPPADSQVAYSIGELCSIWTKREETRVSVNEKTMRTLETYQSYQRMTLDYFGHNKLVKSFNIAHFEEFRLYLREQKITKGHNTGKTFSLNYTAKIMQHFKHLFEYASDLQWIVKSPFNNQKSPRQKEEKIYLTTEQLMNMQAQFPTENKEINEAITIFLFCSFTGLSYRDYCTLTKKHFVTKGDTLFIVLPYRQKSPIQNRYGQSNIPIFPQAREILERYDMNPEAMPRPESHTLNRHLKFVLGLIDADQRVCVSHARHTFINWAKNELGLNESTIATIVGHASIRTTERSYLNRNLDTVFNDLQKLKLA